MGYWLQYAVLSSLQITSIYPGGLTPSLEGRYYSAHSTGQEIVLGGLGARWGLMLSGKDRQNPYHTGLVGLGKGIWIAPSSVGNL